MNTRTTLISIVPILALLLAAPAAQGSSPYHDWSFSAGGTGFEYVIDVAVDGYGNIYMAGRYEGAVDFGGGALPAYGQDDIVLAKYAPDGAFLWSQGFGSALDDGASDIDVDPYGFVVLTGSVKGVVDLGGGPLGYAGGWDVFIAKFAPDGTHIWSRTYGNASDQYGGGVSFDGSGEVVTTGSFWGTIDLGGGTMVSAGQTDVFLARLDASGAHLWSRRFGSVSYNNGNRVDTDVSGEIVLLCQSYGTFNMGGSYPPGYGGYDVYLARYDPSGSLLWARGYGGAGTDSPSQVALDGTGNIVVTAYSTTSANFGGGPLPFGGGYDGILARYTGAGTHLWSRSFGSTSTDHVYGLATGAAGEITICGRFTGTVDFGGVTMTSVDQQDMFVARYQSDGTHRWSRRIGGTGHDWATGVAVDAHDNVSLVGNFQVALDAGGGPLIGAGGNDILVARFLQGPRVHSVLDIPGDQGGLVNVAWDACTVDNTSDQKISEYTVWRAIDAGAATAMLAGGAMLIDDPSGLKAVSKDVPVVRMDSPIGGSSANTASMGAAAPLYWYMVETVGAIGLANYSAPVPTLYDSTSTSPQNHYFQVIAHTSDPFVYYTSEPDSGYSVDNIAPAGVQNLAAAQKVAGLELKWDANSEADLSHYEIYRGTDSGFPPGPGNLLVATPDTTSLDTDWQWDGGFHYKVFAVDTHGNKSPHALIGPGLVIGIRETPLAAALDQNVPNPFNPTTTIGFTLVEGAGVTLRIYDAAGRLVRTLAEGYYGASHHTVNWNGRDDAGNNIASGVYFYRLTAGAFTDTKKMVLLK